MLKRKQSELLPAVREDPMKIDITKLKITNESLFIEKKKIKIRFLKLTIQNLEIWELFQIYLLITFAQLQKLKGQLPWTNHKMGNHYG